MNEQQPVEKWSPPGGDMEAYAPPPPIGVQTPAQARVDAVSTLLHAAYQRASTLILTPEQDQALSEDFPDEAFKPGASGKEHLIYIEHAFLRDRFNSVFGRGQWSMVRMRPHWAEEYRTSKGQQATRIYCEAALLIKGCYVGEAIGDMTYYPNNDSQNYGDAAEGAMTAAFRRCAKNFGVGLQAFKKDFSEGWKARNPNGTPRPAPAPVPTYRPAQSGTMVPPKPAPAPAPTPAPAPAPAQAAVPGGATTKTREWMIAKLLGTFPEEAVKLWAVSTKLLLPGEALTNWPLSKVPTTGPAIRELVSTIQAWATAQANDDNPMPDDDAPPTDPEPPAALAGEWQNQPWANVVVTVPPAGSQRMVYLQNPDTIGSLYEKTKNGDEAARKRLWGLARAWTPQPWVGNDGQTRQPSNNDLNCRKAFDEFIAWHDNGGSAQ